MNILRSAARLLLKLMGWKLLDIEQRPLKAVVIGYPHTSNWDFPMALIGLAALGFRPRWAGKDTMFAGWRGPIMRWLGGIPVNRRERTGFVGQMAAEFNQRSEFLWVIAPEGTRKLTEGWKSGFYRIAIAANVPVVAAVVDYPNRAVGFLATLSLSGNEADDMIMIAECYKGRQGYRPEKTSPIKLI
jgi:1-acyl-sn-glycerol-3-phosphate acyltransferase